MSDVAIQIFESVKGDPAAIRALAVAVAGGDVAAIQTVLTARGVHVADAAVEQIVTAAKSPHGAANITTTITIT